jgi:hypothetical protein
MVDRQQEVVIGRLVRTLLGRQRRTVTARHYFLRDLGVHLSNHRVIRHETRPSVVNWAAIIARAQHQTPIFHHRGRIQPGQRRSARFLGSMAAVGP